jgi:molybdenum-dependent DNA-binding transcriptional regulator ModE
MAGTEIALGPGRVELLELVGQTGSLRTAAQQMGTG